MDWLSKARSKKGPTVSLKNNSSSNNQRDLMVREMKKIVGSDCDECTIRSCLFLSKNNLEHAVDRYFSLEHQSMTNNVSNSPTNDASGSPSRNRGVKRPRSTSSDSHINIHQTRTLGWCLVTGRITTKGKNQLAVGDVLVLVRDSTGSSFVRFATAQDPLRHVGTLEPHVASFFGPLLDNGILLMKATCQVLPDGPLTSFSSIQIGLEVSVTDLKCLHTSADDKIMRKHVHALIVYMFPQVQAKVEQEERREAAKQSTAQDRQSVNKLFDDDENTDAQKDHDDANIIDENKFSFPSDVRASDVDEALQAGMRIALKQYQMDALRWMLSRERSHHQESECDGGSGSGSGGSGGSSTTINARSLMHNHAALLEAHPLWVRLPLQKDDHENGTQDEDGVPDSDDFLFVNPYSKEIKTGKESPELKPCRGGILADEMGLGKTVEVLTLLVVDKALRKQQHRRNQLAASAAATAAAGREGGVSLIGDENFRRRKKKKKIRKIKGENKETRATLVVVPMSVLGQWQDEIRKCTIPGALTFTQYYGNTAGIGGDNGTSSKTSSSSIHSSSSGGNGGNGGSGGSGGSSSSSSSSSSSGCGSGGGGGGGGSGAFKSQSYLSTFDVVLTTFGTLAAEMMRMEKGSSTSTLLSIQWRRVVLDEAHTIKNRSTWMARSCCQVRASRRWCLTGTPMQNGTNDLFSLVIFLKHQPWSEHLWWNKVIQANVLDPTVEHSSSQSNVNNVQMLRLVLEPIMLRRTKLMIMEAKSGVYAATNNYEVTTGNTSNTSNTDLPLGPPDIQEVRLCFSTAEREFYDGLFKQTKAEFTGFASAGTLSNNYATLLTLLLRLRQACDHPYLVIGTSTDDVTSRPSSSSSVLSFFKQSSKVASIPVETSAQTNVAEDESTTPSSSRDQVRKEATEHLFRQWQESNRRNETSATTTTSLTKTTNMPPPRHVRDLLSKLAQGTEEELECPVCFDKPGTAGHDGVAVVTPCGHLFCEECLFETLKYPSSSSSSSSSTSTTSSSSASSASSISTSATTNHQIDCPICRVSVDHDMIFRLVGDQGGMTQTYRALLPGERVRGKTENSPKQDIHATAAKVAPRSSDLRSGRIALHSAKLDAMVVQLRRGFHQPTQDEEKSEPQHVKAVVFSQWTQMLNLVGYVLDREQISYIRLDGSMSQQTRQRQLKQFRTRSDIKVMVMSLKAGSLGLNLTCASLVIMLDPWWNPAVEDQAINRCHRIGQTRKVQVLRMIVEQTCEQRMLALQKMKSSLATSVLTAGIKSHSHGNTNSLTLDALKMFFK